MSDDFQAGDRFQASDGGVSDHQAYDPRYLGGIGYFNECDFFEAHETWEELWTEYRGDARKYYQGLIQVAVALHHFGNGNIRGAKKVYLTSRGYLQEYPATYEGLDLETFLSQYQRCFAEILNNEEEYPKIDIDPDLIPEIHLANQQTNS
jgi:predicted metal-dependent hydrolase